MDKKEARAMVCDAAAGIWGILVSMRIRGRAAFLTEVDGNREDVLRSDFAYRPSP